MRNGITLFLLAVLLFGGGAQASSLDKDSCTRLEEEQDKLEKAGVRTTMDKGAVWGKANLPLDKLQEVRRLIEVDELLLFRCQGKPLVLLPSNVDAEPTAPTEEGQEAGAAGKAAPAGQAKDAKPPAAKKAAAVKTDAAVGEAKTDAAAKKLPAVPKAAAVKAPADAKAAEAKPKAAPKRKVDDAYKPPLPDPGENPFATQDATKK